MTETIELTDETVEFLDNYRVEMGYDCSYSEAIRTLKNVAKRRYAGNSYADFQSLSGDITDIPNPHNSDMELREGTWVDPSKE